jgi:radical SAM superfamily enzyme YgiQ (UPF0313 family)
MSVNALIFTEVMEKGFGTSRAVGAYKIAYEIRSSGYTAQVIDFFTEFSDEEMDKIISSFIGSDTLIVGFSSTFFMYKDETLDGFQQTATNGKKTQPSGCLLPTNSYPYHWIKIKHWFNKMHQINPHLKIVFGGSKSGLCSGLCDAFAIGYCDEAIVNYMKFLEGKNPFFQYEQINQHQIVFFGDKNTRTFNFVDSMFEWHETDHVIHGEVLPIEISRGCVFKCKFCAYPLNGKKKLDFIRSSDILRDTFLKNYYEHGVTRYMYGDDTHNDSVEKLHQLHKVVTSLPFEIEYVAFLRHDLIYAHKETAGLLRESGLRSVVFGIETLNHNAGKAIGKGLHPEKTKELLYWLREDAWKNEVAMSSGFIVGLPYDTPETIYDWSRWLMDMSCPLDSVRFEPLYITNAPNSIRIWRSEFELSSEKFGYTLGNTGNWFNEHFSYASARDMANDIMAELQRLGRLKNAGFPIMIAANSGFNPKDLIGVNRSTVVQQIKEKGKEFIQKYKDAIMCQINNN